MQASFEAQTASSPNAEGPWIAGEDREAQFSSMRSGNELTFEADAACRQSGESTPSSTELLSPYSLKETGRSAYDIDSVLRTPESLQLVCRGPQSKTDSLQDVINAPSDMQGQRAANVAGYGLRSGSLGYGVLLQAYGPALGIATNVNLSLECLSFSLDLYGGYGVGAGYAQWGRNFALSNQPVADEAVSVSLQVVGILHGVGAGNLTLGTDFKPQGIGWGPGALGLGLSVGPNISISTGCVIGDHHIPEIPAGVGVPPF